MNKERNISEWETSKICTWKTMAKTMRNEKQ